VREEIDFVQQEEPRLPAAEQSTGDGDAYSTLRRAIVELYLQPGIILSIKDICEHFEMGRSPVRDALIRLDQEGLVTLLPQRGTMISKIDLSRVEQERFLRLSVEEEVMKLFMACHTPSDIVPLHEALRRQRVLCEQKTPDMREFLTLDDAFHAIFYATTGKLLCLRTVQNASGHYRRLRLLTCGSANGLEEIVEQHGALITSFQTRDTDLMRRLFHVHLSKLDREERTLLKHYRGLFEQDTAQESAALPWTLDYLKTMQS
ncbi:MAG: GntR family transcriptional regulator, partial [Ruthenibacterium sp.]